MFEFYFPADSSPPGMNRVVANATFNVGGYYSYRIPNTDLYFIGLNTMYYKEDNKCSYDVGDS